ncbi:hypothetical protein BIV57_05640 [Mangrovactinospora gilvigrisea]|uniref:Transmembrane protein n=1 Tax=Mangrovactinospora gilvigrisea TaxID=1428644 RepID=A0A1J7CAE3_9ACTN|nr:hypothetical protein [Mangrovactinospora gilvigrisea]OIV38484.1 hypothetical protein BIV57_05640 [Mangrovactinospora gilvigrisea]
MDSAPHLRAEDRPEFERVLADALRSERVGRALESTPVLNLEQLRTAALEAAPAIAAAAAEEYAEYLAARELLLEQSADERGSTLSAVLKKPSGVGPVMLVLTPVLSGAAAVIFLVVGYLMAAFKPEPPLAESLRTAGWLFAAIALAAFVAGMAALLVTAMRHSSAARRESPAQRAHMERARDDWREALTRNGIDPFVDRSIATAQGLESRGRVPRATPGPVTPARRSPDSPSSGEARRRPGFSSPGFSTAPESLGGEPAVRASRLGAARPGTGPARADGIPEQGESASDAPERGPAADEQRLESRTSRMMRRLGRPKLPRRQ